MTIVYKDKYIQTSVLSQKLIFLKPYFVQDLKYFTNNYPFQLIFIFWMILIYY